MKSVKTKTGEGTTFLAKVYSKHDHAACWVEDRDARDQVFFLLSRHDVTVLREWVQSVDDLLAREESRISKPRPTEEGE